MAVFSYNGWAASSTPSKIGIVHFEPIPGYDFPGGIKDGDVKVVFTYLVQQLHERVEPITHYPPGDEWGYAFRDNVNNPGQLSCHASGTAIDYNATEHPNRVAYTWTREQAREINEIVNDELDGVIKWLEGYDEMHFEIRGTPAQVRTVANKIRNGTIHGPTPVPDPSPSPKEANLVYRIYWFKQGRGPVEAHRCLCAKAEKGGYIIHSTNWIVNPAELDAWRKKGLVDANTGATPIVPRSYYEIHGGAYDNTTAF